MAKKNPTEPFLTNKDGKPFAKPEDCMEFIRKEELDPKQWTPWFEPTQGGYVVADVFHLREQAVRGEKKAGAQKSVLDTGPFKRFVLQARSNDNQDDTVFVGVNEVECFVWREAPFALPQPLFTALTTSMRQKFDTVSDRPGGGVVKVGRPMKEYPVQDVQEISEAEFKKFWAWYQKVRTGAPNAGPNPLTEEPARN